MTSGERDCADIAEAGDDGLQWLILLSDQSLYSFLLHDWQVRYLKYLYTGQVCVVSINKAYITQRVLFDWRLLAALSSTQKCAISSNCFTDHDDVHHRYIMNKKLCYRKEDSASVVLS